ncbi:hypothetical protein D3C85_1361560 [compost metagenome]
MLTRVVVDVIHMPGEVVFVANAVFPEAALPDAAFAFAGAAFRHALVDGQIAGEPGLDQPPAQGVIGIARWQCPQGMKVVGEDDNCVDAPRVAFHAIAETGSEQVDPFGE